MGILVWYLNETLSVFVCRLICSKQKVCNSLIYPAELDDVVMELQHENLPSYYNLVPSMMIYEVIRHFWMKSLRLE